LPTHCVADTHAIAYYLADKVPSRLDRIFREAEAGDRRIYVSAISIAELIYLFEKTEAANKVWEMFDRFEEIPNLMIHPLDLKVLRRLLDVKLSEIHDRIIVATALTVGAKAVLTKDHEIVTSRIVKTIW